VESFKEAALALSHSFFNALTKLLEAHGTKSTIFTNDVKVYLFLTLFAERSRLSDITEHIKPH